MSLSCVRFFASGDGIVAKDGLQLFEWIRDPSNLTRLRNGLQHVYEIDEHELPHFLQFKLEEDEEYREEQMSKYEEGGDMFLAYKQKHEDFNSLETGIEKLEAISNATQLTVIPRASPRKRPGKSQMRHEQRRVTANEEYDRPTRMVCQTQRHQRCPLVNT